MKDPFVNVSVRVSRETWKAFRREALELGTSTQGLMNELLVTYLARKARKQGGK